MSSKLVEEGMDEIKKKKSQSIQKKPEEGGDEECREEKLMKWKAQIRWIK